MFINPKCFLNNEERYSFLKEKPFPFALSLVDGKFKVVDDTLVEESDKKKKVKIYAKHSDKTTIKSYRTKEERDIGLYGVTGFGIEFYLPSPIPWYKYDANFGCNEEKREVEMKGEEHRYNTIDSLTTHFTAAIKKEDIVLNKGIEEKINNICFEQPNKKNSEKLKELEEYLTRIGLFVPLKVTYGSRFTHYFTSENQKASSDYAKSFSFNLGIEILNIGYKSEEKKSSLSLKGISELYSNSVGSGAGVKDLVEYKKTLNKLNYDAVLYENLECILEFVSKDLREKVTNFTYEAKQFSGIVPYNKINELQMLDLSNSNLRDINFLKDTVNGTIAVLNLSNNPDIADYSPIESLNRLQNLSLENNNLKSISFIKPNCFDELTTLNLVQNKNIAEFDPLGNLRNIKEILLTKVSISWLFNDIKILKTLKERQAKFIFLSE